MIHRTRKSLLLFAVLVSCWPASAAFAVSADLDSSFGNAGRLEIPLGYATNTSIGYLHAYPGPDGDEYISYSHDYKMRVLRIRADGSRDTSFGDGNGVVVGGNSSRMTLDSSGRFLTCSYVESKGSTLTRTLASGKADTSFGVDGSVAFDANPGINSRSTGCTNVTVLDSGNILVWISGSKNGLVAFHDNGTLDSTTGVNGVISLPSPSPGGNELGITYLAQARDGSFWIQEDMRGVITPFPMRLIHLNADGSNDASFHGGTPVDFNCGAWAQTGGVFPVADNGTLVLLGCRSGFDKPTGGIFGYRFDSTGGYLDTFGDHGTQTYVTDTEGTDAAGTIPRPGGGWAVPDQRSIMGITADGLPDINFGIAGLISIPVTAAFSDSTALVMRPDGKLDVVRTVPRESVAGKEPIAIEIYRYRSDSADLSVPGDATASARARSSRKMPLSLQNRGPLAARHIVLTLRLPTGVRLKSIDRSFVCRKRAARGGTVITCNRASLYAGRSSQLRLRFKGRHGTSAKIQMSVRSTRKDNHPRNNHRVLVVHF